MVLRERMIKSGKIIAYIQIVVILCSVLYNVGITINCPKKPVVFPCKKYDCGCKLEVDCIKNCCCLPYDNYEKDQNDVKKQKNGFQSFISSLRCKSGNNTIAFINIKLEYILKDRFNIPPITFLCFFINDTLAHLHEVMVSPPEKPPRISYKVSSIFRKLRNNKPH